ncbi:hypothetical protein EV141_2469 [Microcella putealis]|uniref:Uncharacterized protein n=1 Tax=Microcella putealis TaxID=337005 RepID=A0A4Q7LJA6_9MICO|nr:hypothetical protein [Microcella putealis]RZS53519.1 hypothetical protein EV141_2469 [Microcella putealis]TQM26963.1 hypothetical protein BJ957_0386 [Microcella putealis]
MEELELTRALNASRPEVVESSQIDALAKATVVDSARKQAPRLTTKAIGVIAASLIGGITLTTGVAYAAPLISEWWAWTPAEDAVLTTNAFFDGNAWVRCEIMLSVTTDGQTATDDSAARLLEARTFIASIDPETYTSDAEAILERDLDAYPDEMRNLGVATQMAISRDLGERGFLGEGVSLESRVDCTAP